MVPWEEALAEGHVDSPQRELQSHGGLKRSLVQAPPRWTGWPEQGAAAGTSQPLGKLDSDLLFLALGAQMVPISWCEMQCPRTHSKELRKVARVQPEFLQT